MRYTFTLTRAIVAAALLAPVLWAGENPQAGDSDLRAKIKALEERVQKLEDALAKERGARGGLRNNGWQFRVPGPDMDQLLEQMQRQIQGAWGWGPDGQPQVQAGKPRLGVKMEPPSNELRERFKNDVKEGAFVIEVVPGSPAESAGLNVGDCITSFNGKDIKSPEDLLDAVKAAPRGKTEFIVARRGEALKLKVELGEPQAEEDDAAPTLQHRWLWRGDGQGGNAAKSRVEVKASALELTDKLAKELKLTAEQKKKMGEVLAKHSQALTEEAAIKTGKGGRRGGSTFSLNGDVSGLVDKHVAAAEKELADTLSPEQLQQWVDYRKKHSSLSFSYSSATTEQGGGPEADNGEETMNF